MTDISDSVITDLARSVSCPRADHPRYAADCLVRHLLAHPESAPPPPWRIVAGIGTLTLEASGAPPHFAPAVAQQHMPSLTERAALLASAVSRWVAAGLPVAPPTVLDARRAACAACPHFAPPAAANGWLGGCRSCGCTGAKLHLATESCPLGRWAACS